MGSSSMPSMIERRPRAPVLRSIALQAMAPSASSAKVRSMLSISNSRWYCLTRAFFGSSRMRLSVGSSRSPRVATTGRRPTNSGIRPYFNRSSGSTSRKISPVLRSSGPATMAPKPIEVERPRAEMIFSRPPKAPPHTNRMLVVSICKKRVVKKDMDEHQQRIERLDRFQEPDRRDGVDGYDLDHPGLSGREVDRAVNIDPIATARLFDRELLLFWCPAAGRPRRMGRMHRVREQHGLVVAQGIQ